MLGPFAGTDHDGRGRGQSQRAGAGNDEHGHEVDQRQRQASAGRGQIKPQHERQDGNDHHRGHENGADLIGQPLNGGAAALGVLHQLHNLREHGIGPHLGHPEAKGAGFVERGPKHGVARLLLHRQAFAREHGLVQGRVAFGDEAIGGHLFAGAHHDYVAQVHLLDGHIHFRAIGPHHAGGFGLQADEAAHGRRRLGFGPQLQHLAQQNQGNDGCRGIVVYLGHQAPAGETKPGTTVAARL